MKAIIEPRITAIRSCALLLACFVGCAQSPLPAELSPEGWKAELQAADGRPVYAFRATASQVRLKDGAGELLVTLRIGSAGVQIENGVGRVMGVVLRPSEQPRALRIVAPGGRETLLELRVEPDGDFKLTDPSDVVLYKVKSRDYGFKVVDSEGRELSSVRVREGKVSVRAEAGGTFLSTRDPLPAEAVAVMTLDRIPVEYRAGLAVAITRGMPSAQPR